MEQRRSWRRQRLGRTVVWGVFIEPPVVQIRGHRGGGAATGARDDAGELDAVATERSGQGRRRYDEPDATASPARFAK